MNIGERVFYLLKLKGKKQTDLANTLAIPKTTVNGWRQNNKNPSSDLIIPISEYFGVSCEYLLTGEEKQIENSDNHTPTNDELLELQLLGFFRKLNNDGKHSVIIHARACFDDSDYLKNLLMREQQQSKQ